MGKYNPFNPNSVVVPTLFAGRASQVNEICKKLTQLKHGMPASYFVYGERGIGKTALVKLIRYVASLNEDKLHELNLITSYYSAEQGQEISSILQESLNKLTDEMDSALVAKIGSRLGEIFKNGKFEIGAFGTSLAIDTTESKLKREITVKDQTVSILSNIIKSISSGEGKKKDGILIVIDEIHNVGNLATAASIIRNIVTTLDVENLGKVSFIIIGYEEDVSKFFSQDSSAKRMFDFIPLDVMPDGDAMDILKKGFEAAGVKFDEAALRENISMAGGYPHSIQILGYHLIETDTDGQVDQKDWDRAAIDAMFTLRSKEFAAMYSFGKPLTVKDEILSLLAKENRPLLKKEIADQLKKKNIYQYIPVLKKIGAIRGDADKKLQLQSQLLRTAILFDQFIRKNEIISPSTIPHGDLE